VQCQSYYSASISRAVDQGWTFPYLAQQVRQRHHCNLSVIWGGTVDSGL